MSEIIDLVVQILHALLILGGIFIIILVLRVYGLYQRMKINKSVMTPMLFAGLFMALSGISELMELYFGEIGHVAHAVFMFLTAIAFIYGIYGYQKMLNRAK